MKKSILNVVLILLLLFVAVSSTVSAQEPISLGEADWPGIWAKNAVAKHIMTNIGYDVEIKAVKNVMIYNSMADQGIDIYLGSWMPSDKPIRKEMEGKIEVVTTNLEEGLYTLGVPKYAWEAGVKSFADLDEYAEKFDHKIYAGPVGWAFTEAIQKAIDNDIYGLGDWEIVNSSQTAMIANMKRAMKKEDWIVTLAWKPHWMNYIMDIKYLEDPKDVWVSAESWVNTLTRNGFKDDNPQIYKFLEQFKVNSEMSNEWIYYIGYKEQEPKEVAKNWVENNPDVVEKWLQGVKTKDGKDAFKVLKENLKL